MAEEMFQRGWYLNDLYMYVTSTMIDRHDKDFRHFPLIDYEKCRNCGKCIKACPRKCIV